LEVAYSADGSTVAVVCSGGEILLTDTATGQIRKRLHQGATEKYHPKVPPKHWVMFSPNSRRVVTLGRRGIVSVWETSTGDLLATLKHSHFLRDCNFSTDGLWFATACQDGSVRIWDAATYEPEVGALNHPNWAFSVKFSPDGRYLLTGCRDNQVRLWDWRAGKLVCPTMEHDDEVFDAGFSPDGRWLITVGRDQIMRAWEWTTGMQVAPSKRLPAVSHYVYITPDGQHAVVTGNGSTLLVIHLNDLAATEDQGPDPTSFQMLGEIVCGRRIEGTGTVKLTSAEWIARWNAYEQRHPEHLRRLAKTCTTH
jgi:WD40 repeat protein